jgi:diadenosine tetraphosphate (Ap4A) HIT family hydrolase
MYNAIKEIMRHYRKTVKEYAKFIAKDKQRTICTFCNELIGDRPNVITENDTMFIIPNRVSYDIFEGQRVTDHLMVIPKRHLETLSDFKDVEKLDQMNFLAEYEKKGYDVYARGVGNIARSVSHQHTHLIKTNNKKKWPRFLLFINRPYILISK